jgi:hypothetical protein
MERDQETEKALELAALQASLYHHVEGEAKLLKQKTTSGIGYLEDLEIHYNKDRAQRLKDQLEIISEVRSSEGTAILAKLSSQSIKPITLSLPPYGSQPEWVNNPPSLENRLVGVGVAQRRFRLRDSIIAADKKALEELLGQVSTKIATVQSKRSVEGTGTVHETTSLEVVRAELSGYYVLSRWNNGEYFYTLAVCDKP